MGNQSDNVFNLIITEKKNTRPPYKDEAPAVRVYTVCDESRYLIVRNVPSLGCGDELSRLFSSYGDVEECKPMDAEDCEKFTDVYWIKFRLVSNSRFAKRKLDEYVFLGNRLGVSYVPQYESLADTKDKLEGRRREVLARLNPCGSKGPRVSKSGGLPEVSSNTTHSQTYIGPNLANSIQREYGLSQHTTQASKPPLTRVSSEKEYFASPSMNQTVQMVREKLDKIQSNTDHLLENQKFKKPKVDNRRRI